MNASQQRWEIARRITIAVETKEVSLIAIHVSDGRKIADSSPTEISGGGDRRQQREPARSPTRASVDMR
jgi:hypothetical protein